MLDTVIRGGFVIDGTGDPRFRADVGIEGGRIVSIGRIKARGRRDIDAQGHVVTPGFIDGHTHMDAQVNWDPLGTSSCWHGITTMVMGNCGFSLAPCKPGEQALVLRNLERAEDIAAAAMAAGIKWGWETFPEYLDALDALPKATNYAAYIGHSALRTWAMGERAFEQQSSPEDLARMKAQLQSALRAGAIGFSTSRSMHHETSDQRPVASRLASWQEVRELVGAMADVGAGVFELAHEECIRQDDPERRSEYVARLHALALESGATCTFGIVAGKYWRELLQLFEDAAAAGGRIYGQSRPWGLARMLSFRTHLAFDRLAEWRPIRAEPIDVQKRLFRDPQIRRRLIEAAHQGDYGRALGPEPRKPDWNLIRVYEQPFPGNPKVADLAKARGLDPVELMIDLALQSDFEQLFIETSEENPDPDELPMTLRHPWSVMTFTDAGAHVNQILSSMQTYLLAYWVRERQLVTLEEGVRMITAVPAKVWGFPDRGLLRPGMVADINILDPATVGPGMPRVVKDLPAGEQRLVQPALGFLATLVRGEVILERGEHTGALPGRLIRSSAAHGAW